MPSCSDLNAPDVIITTSQFVNMNFQEDMNAPWLLCMMLLAVGGASSQDCNEGVKYLNWVAE